MRSPTCTVSRSDGVAAAELEAAGFEGLDILEAIKSEDEFVLGGSLVNSTLWSVMFRTRILEREKHVHEKTYVERGAEHTMPQALNLMRESKDLCSGIPSSLKS